MFWEQGQSQANRKKSACIREKFHEEMLMRISQQWGWLEEFYEDSFKNEFCILLQCNSHLFHSNVFEE